MMLGMKRMAMRDMGVMAGLLVIALFMLFRRFAVMFRSGFVMIGCCVVMSGLIGAGHGLSPSLRRFPRRHSLAASCKRHDARVTETRQIINPA